MLHSVSSHDLESNARSLVFSLALRLHILMVEYHHFQNAETKNVQVKTQFRLSRRKGQHDITNQY
jgi:hypothetical protein